MGVEEVFQASEAAARTELAEAEAALVDAEAFVRMAKEELSVHLVESAALQEALRIDPYDAAAWDLAGRALAEKRQFPEALFDFERALRYRPDFAPYLYDYALTLSSAGQFERAQESAEQYLLFEKLPVANEGDFGISISYEFDLFGKLRRGTEAALADTESVQAAGDLANVVGLAKFLQRGGALWVVDNVPKREHGGLTSVPTFRAWSRWAERSKRVNHAIKQRDRPSSACIVRLKMV